MRIKILMCTLLTISSSAYSLTNQERDDENSIFCKLKGCAKQRLYYHMSYTLPIENVTDSQPDGYIVRLSFYQFGFGDTNIILAEKFLADDHTMNWRKNWAYKIGIQTSTEYDKEPHINIRKLIDNEDKSVDVLLTTENIKLNEKFKSFPILKILIEVTKVGHINMYFNDDPKPLVAAYDINVIEVKDVSFSANSVTSIYYDCPSDATDLPKQLSTSSLVPAENIDLSSASPDVLAANCKWYETWHSDNEKIEFIEISSIKDSQPDDYWLRLPLYMVYDSYVKILLTMDQSNWKFDIHLTIEIDALEHTIRVIDTYGSVIGSVQFADSKQAKLEIRIPKNKPIEIFFGYFTKKPILTVETDMEQNLNYVGFTSINSTRALFFYECSDRNVVLPQHEFLIEGITSSGNETSNLRQNCTSIQLNNVTYPEYVNLSTIQASLPNEFTVRIPFYVQGSKDVYVLLSESVWSKHNSYEIVIGASNNKQILIRKNNEVIGSTDRRNILNVDKSVKFVVEITRAGEIRIFTEYNTSKPILEVVDSDLIKTLQFISFNGRDRSTEFLLNCK